MTIKDAMEINRNWDMKTITTKRMKEDKMKSFRKRTLAFMLMALAALLVPGMAMAVGTSATGTVDNTATLNYSVATVPQSAITNTASFQVDRKVEFSVAWVADANVSPGLVNGVLVYTVSNLANDALGFTLNYESVANTIAGGMGNVEIYIDDGNGTWDGVGTEGLYTIGTNAFDLAEGAAAVTNTVYIVADTPIGASNLEAETFALIANAVLPTTTTPFTNTAGVNTLLGTPDNVLADGAGTATGDVAYDGTHSASATFNVASAVITVEKDITQIYSDPINGVSVNAKAIPGAIVEYQIVVTQTAGTPAVLTTLGDAFTATELALAAYPGAYHVEVTCTLLPAVDYSCNGGTDTYTNGVGTQAVAGAGTWTFDMAQMLPADGVTHTTDGEIQNGESVTIKYRMQIQ